jgi:SAM-dependent methyltransferase
VSGDINYQYFHHVVGSLPNASRLRILDYGCGVGEIVALMRQDGLNAIGCDTFYAGIGHREAAKNAELAERQRTGVVVEVPEEGDLPFPPHSFDVILTNQVFEHVTDLPATFARVERMLAPDGVMLFHFPADEGWREGHMGVPLAHWFPKGKNRGTLRWWYTFVMRRLGLGYFKERHASAAEWTDHWLDWIDKYTFYRPYPEIAHVFGQHCEIRHAELRYVEFRARTKPLIRWAVRQPMLCPLARWAFVKLAFLAFELRFTPEYREQLRTRLE